MLLITFLQNEYINTTVLPDKKKGHYKLNHSIQNAPDDINIDGIENQWILSAGSGTRIFTCENGNELRQVESAPFDSDDVLIVEINGIKCTLIVETINDDKNRFTKFCFTDPSAADNSFSIGKRQDNDIVLDDSYISGRHAVIGKRDNRWYVIDQNSRNGTYVGNRKIDSGVEYPLEIGDVIIIVGYRFIICSDFFSANIDNVKSVRGTVLSKVIFPKFHRPTRKNVYDAEYFYRTVDLGENAPDLPVVKLLPPEHTVQDDDQSILLSIGSSMTMSVATVSVAIYNALAAYYRKTDMTYIIPSFIMAGSMVLSSIFWPVIIKKHRRKTLAEKEAMRTKDYQDYIMDLRASVSVMMDNEKEYLRKKYLTVDECMGRVVNRDRYLWSKSVNDDDFMVVAVGTGKRESSVTVKFSDDSDAFFKDDLKYDMMQFAYDKRILDDAPITISLNNGCICGVSGEKSQSCEIIKEIVVQLASLYSYD